LQVKNLETKTEADKIGSKLDGKSFPVIRQASETGQLYGSVSPRDLAALLTENGFEVDRNQIALNVPIKTIGQHKVPINLHPEVEITVTINVARSADEAERLVRGENVTVRREGGADEDEAEAAKATAEAFFEPGVAEAAAEDDANAETAANEAGKDSTKASASAKQPPAKA
jgi:large subunit ribosomal protein L9